MPEQPERDIERQLRASAEQRRAEAGAPFELPDATRRRLQVEVTRRYSPREDRRSASSAWWLALWPRFAVGGAMLAVLGLGLWLSVPTSSNKSSANLLVASNERDSAAKADKQFSQPAPNANKLADAEAPAEARAALAPATTLATDRREEKKSEQILPEPAARSLAESAISPLSPAAPAPTVATAAPKSVTGEPSALEVATATQPSSAEDKVTQAGAAGRRGGGRQGGGFGGGGGGRGGFGGAGPRSSFSEQGLADSSKTRSKDGEALSAASTPSPSVEIARAQVAPAPASSGSTPTIVLGDMPLTGRLFRNSAAPTNARSDVVTARRSNVPARAPSPPSVLSNFRAEQTGDALRIVDEDGSVYEGKLQVPVDIVALTKAKELSVIQTQTRARGAQLADSTVPSQTQPLPSALNFNVSGVNRSLAQRVVFTGQLQQAISPGAVNSQSNAQFFATTPVAAQAGLSNTQTQQTKQVSDAGFQQRIVGRARLGATPEFEVDAYSTSK